MGSDVVPAPPSIPLQLDNKAEEDDETGDKFNSETEMEGLEGGTEIEVLAVVSSGVPNDGKDIAGKIV